MFHLQLVSSSWRHFCSDFFGIPSDSLPWTEMSSSRRKLWIAHEIEITKDKSQSIGLTFREVRLCIAILILLSCVVSLKDFILGRYEEMVVIESISPKSPASKTELKRVRHLYDCHYFF
jgi:hypothetical protein